MVVRKPGRCDAMTLQLCTDLSPADWLVRSDLPWDRLVTFGPSGFQSYARLRFIPDPEYSGQQDSDAAQTSPDHDQLTILLAQLADRTTTPDDCYFCLWDGWGSFTVPLSWNETAVDLDPFAVPATSSRSGFTWAPATKPPDPRPKINLPNRSYYLFHGPLSDLGDWGVGERGFPEPVFVWPSDHAWCVTKDVDPHWAGIAADQATVNAIIDHGDLDIVPADPAERPPAYG